MNVVKKCLKHGNLSENQVIKSGKHNPVRCRACYIEVRKNNYKKNKEKIKEKNKNWREANPERNRELNKLSRRRRTGIAESAKQFPERNIKFHRARARLRNILCKINKVIRDADKND